MKLAKPTTSQVRVLLADSPCAPITADQVKDIALTGKFGWPVSQMAADAAKREHAVLMVNLAGDCLSPELAKTAGEKMAAACAALAEYAGAEDILIAGPQGVSLDVPNARAVTVEPNPVLREESALYHLVETGELRSAPLEREFPSQGYQGRPTVAIDGESLLKLYAMTQPEYRETKLVLVDPEGEPQLAEVPLGVPVKTLLEELEIGPFKALLLGGVTGCFSDGGHAIAWDDRFDSIRIYTDKHCMADALAKLLSQAREKSCGKCVLCREGVWHLAEIFQSVTQGKAKKDDLDMVMDIGPLMEAGSFCSFGQRMARMAVSGLECSRSEMEAHITKKKCPAGVCAAFNKKLYCIDPTLCTGCGDCEDECSEMAIEGKKKFIYMIDPDMCTGCGECAKACDEEAIVVNDGSIKLPKKLTKVGKFK